MVALYYILPLDRLDGSPAVLSFAVGFVLLVGVGAWQIRTVLDAEHPSIRAIESLSGYVPLLLVLFAADYYLMARADPASFNVHILTRTDSLYFTLTIFSTVGFGDTNATSQGARVVVMVQIVLNLTVLGLGVRLLTQAVHIGEARRQNEQPPHPTTTPRPTA